MVAGTDRVCTQLMAAFGDRIFCKSGASAFYAVGIKDKGIGIALKMEDGASSIVHGPLKQLAFVALSKIRIRVAGAFGKMRASLRATGCTTLRG